MAQLLLFSLLTGCSCKQVLFESKAVVKYSVCVSATEEWSVEIGITRPLTSATQVVGRVLQPCLLFLSVRHLCSVALAFPRGPLATRAKEAVSCNCSLGHAQVVPPLLSVLRELDVLRLRQPPLRAILLQHRRVPQARVHLLPLLSLSVVQVIHGHTSGVDHIREHYKKATMSQSLFNSRMRK